MIQKHQFEEGVTCLDCNLQFEAETLIYGSLDAYNPLDETFCPKCESDNLKFHKPLEDK